ncbi:hypothetical protein [Pseudomonas denitrificans (nom. rej.)]|uniref:Uncharacterized protein n=1 Tax=Pseudomonas denitrificans TaxID=43306 RepID=A0A9X7N1L1_PSEDE|nr:hypothetical protein [Pseudomonas denitrificans (nom. rej.)]QEY73215.1 hypothetical protein F1C79_17260 [Pseudomonas denitrificans (nom. rej.)]
MQRFINNWEASLVEALDAGDGVLRVAPELAARLVGLGGDDFYLLTLVQTDTGGQEVAWEIVKATAVTGEQVSIIRAQEGTAALGLPAGASVSARLTAGSLGVLLAQLPTGVQLVPSGGSPGQMLSPTSGGGRAWVTPPGGGSGGFLSRENYATQVYNGALGLAAPLAIYATEGLGALIRTTMNNALQAALAWVTSSITSVPVAVGPVTIQPGDAQSGLVRSANGVSISTGTSAGGSVNVQAAASGLFAAADIQDGSYVQMGLRPDALSGGAQQYALEVNLSLAPFEAIRFGYGSDYSESVWSLYWLDNEGGEQSLETGEAVSTAFMSLLRIEVSGSDMLCKVGATTIHTIPLGDLQLNEESAAQFGVGIDLYKTAGTTPAIVTLGDPAGQISLAPA